MKHTNIIFFTLGAGLGTLGGFFAAKTHYEKLYQQYAEETVQEMKEVMYGVPKDQQVLDEEEEESINPLKWTDEQAKEVRQRLERNRQGTNYAAMYGTVKKNIGGTHDDDEKASDEDTEDSEDDDSETEDPELAEIISRHEASKGRKPRLISADKAAELPPGIDMVELQFYDEDNVLADVDTEERISDVERLVGDCLRKYGFMDSDERVVYVMNDELDTCYEVIRVDASYEETHPDE